MHLKTILYCIIIPISIWAIDSINFEGKFKKNRFLQARVLYILIALGLSYLVVNFFLDFYTYSKFI